MESELISAALQGDESAFSRVYLSYRDRVYNFAFRMVGKRSVAEDVTHEAFLVLVQHPERYQPARGSLLTFLCAVARHHILNHLRRHEKLLAEPVDALIDFQLPADREHDNPLKSLLRSEVAAKVQEAIAALPPLYREAIVLREYQDLSYTEIAMVIGSDVNVVKVRLHRARQSLSRQLASYIITEGDCCHGMR